MSLLRIPLLSLLFCRFLSLFHPVLYTLVVSRPLEGVVSRPGRYRHVKPVLNFRAPDVAHPSVPTGTRRTTSSSRTCVQDLHSARSYHACWPRDASGSNQVKILSPGFNFHRNRVKISRHTSSIAWSSPPLFPRSYLLILKEFFSAY
ncbi:hypothetical protein GOBAR_AA04809 [Gossypium barbadense]|uniref:Secreted protein n=1 Tax=Gossypium barbadense TaxID=3634 RepID=A0A2P5YJK2_GOSBA|nr:hypothetical protein GOBAR_AA04809 [Gossypium barbadense]